MKKILLLSCTITLLANTGCLVAEGGRHDHARFEGPPPPVVVVHAPEVVVRPPEVIVR